MSKEIIELSPEKPDSGQIRYTYSGKPPDGPDPFRGLIARIFSVAIGVGVFFLLIFFFVYVVLPIIVIALIWIFLRNLFKRV